MTYREPARDPMVISTRWTGMWWKAPAPIAVLGIVGVLCYGMLLGFRSCAADHPCVDGTQIQTLGEDRFECSGGHISTETLTQGGAWNEPRVLMHCVCGASVDGGRP